MALVPDILSDRFLDSVSCKHKIDNQSSRNVFGRFDWLTSVFRTIFSWRYLNSLCCFGFYLSLPFISFFTPRLLALFFYWFGLAKTYLLLIVIGIGFVV